MPKYKLPFRSEDYFEWYNQLVVLAELADYAPVRGCMIVRRRRLILGGGCVWSFRRWISTLFRHGCRAEHNKEWRLAGLRRRLSFLRIRLGAACALRLSSADRKGKSR